MEHCQVGEKRQSMENISWCRKQCVGKCVTDIMEIPAKDGKLYVSVIFDCFYAAVLGL